jgi:hypothetical protein
MSRFLSTLITILALITPSTQFTHYEENSCTIVGDADVYGIGVRISYYLTFFSGITALAFANKSATDDAKKGNAIIGFAVLIILIRNATQGSLAVFEFEILFTMMFLLTGVTFIPLAILGDYLTSAALFTVYGLYNMLLPWIFFTLKDQGRREGCELRAFLFAYFDFFNVHWVGFLKFTAVVGCISGCYITIFSLGVGGREIYKRIFSPEEEIEGKCEKCGEKCEKCGGGKEGGQGKTEAKEKGDDDDDDDEENELAYTIFACFALPVGTVSIVFTEKMISGNNIDLSDSTLISTSQLIPFIVGIIGFVSTVWTCVKDAIGKRKARRQRDTERDGTTVARREDSITADESKNKTRVETHERSEEIVAVE